MLEPDLLDYANMINTFGDVDLVVDFRSDMEMHLGAMHSTKTLYYGPNKPSIRKNHNCLNARGILFSAVGR